MTVRARSPDGAQRNPGSLIRIAIPGFRLRFIRATDDGSRHCEERSEEAIHASACCAMDCFANARNDGDNS